MPRCRGRGLPAPAPPAVGDIPSATADPLLIQGISRDPPIFREQPPTSRCSLFAALGTRGVREIRSPASECREAAQRTATAPDRTQPSGRCDGALDGVAGGQETCSSVPGAGSPRSGAGGGRVRSRFLQGGTACRHTVEGHRDATVGGPTLVTPCHKSPPHASTWGSGFRGQQPEPHQHRHHPWVTPQAYFLPRSSFGRHAKHDRGVLPTVWGGSCGPRGGVMCPGTWSL